MNVEILNSLEWLCAKHFHVRDTNNVSIIKHDVDSDTYFVCWGPSLAERDYFTVFDLSAIVYAIDSYFGDHSHSYFEWKHCLDSIGK